MVSEAKKEVRTKGIKMCAEIGDKAKQSRLKSDKNAEGPSSLLWSEKNSEKFSILRIFF